VRRERRKKDGYKLKERGNGKPPCSQEDIKKRKIGKNGYCVEGWETRLFSEKEKKSREGGKGPGGGKMETHTAPCERRGICVNGFQNCKDGGT